MNPGFPILRVSCALITHKAQLLAARRGPQMPEAGLWEFPGGKIQDDETPEMALRREIKEELGIYIEVRQALPPVREQQNQRLLELLPFHCQLQGEMPVAREHSELCWDYPKQLIGLNWIPLDLQILQHWLKHPPVHR